MSTEKKSDDEKILKTIKNLSMCYNEENCNTNFCLKSEDIQPTGSINLSKINNIILNLDFNKLINEEIEIIVFNLSYNILKIQNGICSLLFIN